MNDESKFNPFTVYILSLLLFIRIFYRFGVMYFGYSAIIFSDYYVVTIIYFLSTLSIYLERKRLFNFYIDRKFFLLFVFSGFFGVLFKPLVFSAIPLVCAIFMCCLLVRNEFVFQESSQISINWLVRSILIGFALPILSSIIFRIRLEKSMDFLYAASAFISAFTGTVLLEEILFRGLLCGYLSLRKWSPNRIILVQAFLFWIAHIDYMEKAVYFWIVIPIVSIIFGLIAQKSKSIFWSTITHAIYNTLI